MNLFLYLTTDPINPAWAGQQISYKPHDDHMDGFAHLSSLSDYVGLQKIAKSLASTKYDQISLVGDNWDHKLAFSFLKGIYKPYKSVTVNYPKLSESEAALFTQLAKHHVFLRDLINEPSETLRPKNLVEKAVKVITEAAELRGLGNKVQFKIVHGDSLLPEYPGIHLVGRGSVVEPYYLKADFNPTGSDDTPVVLSLVGKGITFDTGGYSLKLGSGMETMRSDMGGSALMVSSFAQSIASGLNKRVILHIGCAENMISGSAFVLGHIIEYPNGIKVEIGNTDAEGRLVLADCLLQASKDNPKYIIDAATLTGSAKAAVGTDYHSILSLDEDLVSLIMTSAKSKGEKFWRLPFETFHRDQIKTSFADISNTGSVVQSAGASTATAFLSYFVPDHTKNWLHIDASSTFNRRSSNLWSLGATGIGLETLTDLILGL